MKPVPFLIATTILAVLFVSCKKDKDDKADRCKIVGANVTTGSSSSTYTLSYNNQGRLSSVQESGSGSINLALFEYTNNVIRITRASNGTVHSIDSIATNSNGMITYIKNRDINTGSYNETTMSYNGTELSSYISTSNGGSPTIQSATFSNGNLTSLTSGSSISTVTYYQNEGIQPGDFFIFQQNLSYGALYIRNRNLLNTITSGTSVQNFVYNFDGDGRISGLQATSGSSLTQITYTYDCN